MDISELLGLCEKRLVFLNTIQASASLSGDIAQLQKIEEEIAKTSLTLEKLKSLM
jgi:hypothetical protein